MGHGVIYAAFYRVSRAIMRGNMSRVALRKSQVLLYKEEELEGKHLESMTVAVDKSRSLQFINSAVPK